MTKRAAPAKPLLVACHELPPFAANDLDSVRLAFEEAVPISAQQSWRRKQEAHFAPMVVRIGWRGDALLVLAELTDADIFTNATKDNQRLWELGDAFEIFLRPAEQEAYVEFQVAPNNRRLQLRYPNAEAMALARKTGATNRFVIRRQAFHSTTWVCAAEKKWFVLATIPARSVGENAGVLPGAEWLFSFSRYDYTRERSEPVISSTSPHAKADFHRQPEWGVMRFEDSRANGTSVTKNVSMKFHNSSAEIYVPDGQPVGKAVERITHLGIGAHQDDLEFMAFHGILACYDSEKKWFGGVTCTNGSGSARTGPYAKFTDAQIMGIRRREQHEAAEVGRYGVMIQLGYPSSAVKSATDAALKNDLKKILAAARPEVVYTHNPVDKHDTHIGVVVAAIQAMRELPRGQRPKKIWGCEVWRNLDWLQDQDKVLMDVSGHDNLAVALNGIFDSQIAGGKRYDLATSGRRFANATFFESHSADHSTQLIYGMDLTPLVKDESADIADYVCGLIEKFKADGREKLSKRLGRA
jgi:LmbE family N-acetylglucosaminyl deacetylase